MRQLFNTWFDEEWMRQPLGMQTHPQTIVIFLQLDPTTTRLTITSVIFSNLCLVALQLFRSLAIFFFVRQFSDVDHCSRRRTTCLCWVLLLQTCWQVSKESSVKRCVSRLFRFPWRILYNIKLTRNMKNKIKRCIETIDTIYHNNKTNECSLEPIYLTCKHVPINPIYNLYGKKLMCMAMARILNYFCIME